MHIELTILVSVVLGFRVFGRRVIQIILDLIKFW